MTWRSFVSEDGPDMAGILWHTLSCGHRKTALCGRRSGEPVRRQWCFVCSPMVQRDDVQVPRKHVEYVIAVLRDCLVHHEVDDDLAPAAILAFETALRRPRPLDDGRVALSIHSNPAPAPPSGGEREPGDE